MKKPMEKTNHLSLIVIQVKITKHHQQKPTYFTRKKNPQKICRKKLHYLFTSLERDLYSYALH